MSATTTPTPRPLVPDSAHREDSARFVHWSLEQLQLPVTLGERDAILELPEVDRPAFAGQQRLRLPLAGAADAGQESLAWESRFGRWLADRLRVVSPALDARPRQQPQSVADISRTLFSAYEVEGGQTHLAGCQLTDHPFLRLSFAGDDDHVRHVFVAPDGSSIADDLVARLGLDELEPILRMPPRLDEAALSSLVAAGRRIAAKQSSTRDPSAVTVDPLAVCVVWVRHAEGRLQFTIGSANASLPFSSWARLLKPQPYIAKHSGAESFRLAATDDGRIDAADEIAVCQQSGRRVLKQELVECSVTGKQVLGDFTEVCPVSGKPALRPAFATCTNCRQRVSKGVLVDGVCTACRHPSKVTKDDPRLVWIFGEHPGLDRWNRWQLAETQSVYIGQAAGVLKRLLVVVDKETLAVRRLATATRVAPTWTDVPDAVHNELLKKARPPLDAP